MRRGEAGGADGQDIGDEPSRTVEKKELAGDGGKGRDIWEWETHPQNPAGFLYPVPRPRERSRLPPHLPSFFPPGSQQTADGNRHALRRTRVAALIWVTMEREVAAVIKGPGSWGESPEAREGRVSQRGEHQGEIFKQGLRRPAALDARGMAGGRGEARKAR